MQHPKPPFRKLRGYAFDPMLSLQSNTASINSIVYKVTWEDLSETEVEKKKQAEDKKYQPQGSGPVGEYLEVIDYDPTVKTHYEPVDLNDPYLLAQDGLAPSESNPQFHQQMVYAVAMTTIRHFEQALGRPVLWAPRRLTDRDKYEEYVPRLRIYPHALREANAYYSPQKKALLFGYFSAAPARASLQMPGSLVFTCLSHDIIAHETTHAILDGLHHHYNEPSNPDVLAFHEAFADIVALFQHFTFPEVLKKQIAETKGDLAAQSLLGKLAQEFGTAIGCYGSLRDAIGETVDGVWKPTVPNPEDYLKTKEPHARGSILVAAIFEAFINIYKKRVADLLRIASNGTGILPRGELHPDLVNRLAAEAAKAANHILNMCVRALDYCPPVDLTFGEYLRALITADMDLVKDDPRGYRLVIIEAFQRRGIYPEGIKTLSEESLRYPANPKVDQTHGQMLTTLSKFLRDYLTAIMYTKDRKTIYEISRLYMGGSEEVKSLHGRIFEKFEESLEFERLTGIVFGGDWVKLGIRTSKVHDITPGGGSPSFAVENLRLVSRVGPEGTQIHQMVFSLVQRAGVILKDGEFQGDTYVPPDEPQPREDGGFQIRGGCTLIFDLNTQTLKYAITKPLLDLQALQASNVRCLNKARIERQYAYQTDPDSMAMSEHGKFFGLGLNEACNEPFALLHQH